jgi:hypothetical protein
LSLPAAKKPIDRLSGDQNGNSAPSVTGNSRAADPSGRTQSLEIPPEEGTNATERPSGEIALPVRRYHTQPRTPFLLVDRFER